MKKICLLLLLLPLVFIDASGPIGAGSGQKRKRPLDLNKEPEVSPSNSNAQSSKGGGNDDSGDARRSTASSQKDNTGKAESLKGAGSSSGLPAGYDHINVNQPAQGTNIPQVPNVVMQLNSEGTALDTVQNGNKVYRPAQGEKSSRRPRSTTQSSNTQLVWRPGSSQLTQEPVQQPAPVFVKTEEGKSTVEDFKRRMKHHSGSLKDRKKHW